MKAISSIILFSFIIALMTIYGCGKKVDPALSKQQKSAKVLDEGSSWGGNGQVEVIEVPSGINPNELLNLKLTFGTSGESNWTPSSFASSGADDFLATSNASWTWGDKEETIVISLENASSSELTSMKISELEIQFTFQINEVGGRVDGLDGSYTLRMFVDLP